MLRLLWIGFLVLSLLLAELASQVTKKARVMSFTRHHSDWHFNANKLPYRSQY